MYYMQAKSRGRGLPVEAMCLSAVVAYPMLRPLEDLCGGLKSKIFIKITIYCVEST